MEAIEKGSVITQKQEEMIENGKQLKTAPKISKEDCRIDWSWDAEKIYNLIRGLSPYPGAFTEIKTKKAKKVYLKIYKAVIKDCACPHDHGTLITDYKSHLDICCANGCISILEVQQAGKKRMPVSDFLSGLIPNVLDKCF